MSNIVIVTGISKAHHAPRSKRSAVDTGRSSLFVFGYDENCKFQRKKINSLQIPIYRRRLVHRKLVTCPICLQRFTAFYKKIDELANLMCVNCSR